MGAPAYIKRFIMINNSIIQPYMNTNPFNLKLLEMSYKRKHISILTTKFITDSNIEIVFKNAITDELNSSDKFEKYDLNILIYKPKGQMITQETLYINQDDEYQIILPNPTHKIELPNEIRSIIVKNYDLTHICDPYIEIKYSSRFENNTDIGLDLIKYTIKNLIIKERAK